MKKVTEYKQEVSDRFMEELFIQLTEEEYKEEQRYVCTPPQNIKRGTLYSSAYEES